jgi:hypothetical protein
MKDKKSDIAGTFPNRNQDMATKLRSHMEKYLLPDLLGTANYFVKQDEWPVDQVAFEAKDFTNIVRVWALLNNDKLKEAKDFAWNLDTANREMISDDVWDYLTK